MKQGNRFTETDLRDLILLLKGFDIMFPQMCVYIDRVEYELAMRVYSVCCDEDLCNCPQTFEEWHAGVQEARSNYDKSVPADDLIVLALKSLSISEYLKRSVLAFPELGKHVDRLMYEILSFGGKYPSKESFDEFHRQHEIERRIYRPVGVG